MFMNIDSYITVREEASDEVVIMKSRFIGYAAPCETEEDALAFLRRIKEKHRDARHHCYAYVIGLNAGVMRYSDDGEPGGTAGLPMMDVLKNAGAVNCCVVVVRYFGGVLLGTGGLVRAYTLGCKIALEAAGLIRMELSDVLRCRISYPLWNSVQYAVQKLPVQLGDTVYAEDVAFVLIVRKKDSEATVLQLRNLSDGKMTCEPVSEEYKAWDL
ncbi:MAG: YigZ family protein [Clostridia bacterium]|nr:YigZ family protein [Clostridia bacterium]